MKKHLLSCLILISFIFSSSMALSSDSKEAESVVRQGEAILKKIYDDPEYQGFRDNLRVARGVLIIPQMLKGGFFIGGAGGSGALFAKDVKTGEWGYPAFYSIGAISIGLQIGGESSELVMLIMSDSGFNSLLATSFKLGADATVAAGPVGAGGKAVTADILAYAKSKGLFAGVSVEGDVIQTKDDWNRSYYNASVSTTDILISKTVSNPTADSIRAALKKYTTPAIQ